MEKQIDESVLKRVKTLCENLLMHYCIDSATMSKAKYLTMMYLNKNGYTYSRVKCDYENNPPDSIYSQKLIIQFFEREYVYKIVI